uniref:Ig-like domain-containing protein n=1 Tax=Syphacia muris TaxID=451379 RepID=A0A0N5AEP2_9BILA
MESCNILYEIFHSFSLSQKLEEVCRSSSAQKCQVMDARDQFVQQFALPVENIDSDYFFVRDVQHGKASQNFEVRNYFEVFQIVKVAESLAKSLRNFESGTSVLTGLDSRVLKRISGFENEEVIKTNPEDQHNFVRPCRCFSNSCDFAKNLPALLDDVSEIERAIFEVSERILNHESVSNAHAELNEELLKATLESAITQFRHNHLSMDDKFVCESLKSMISSTSEKSDKSKWGHPLELESLQPDKKRFSKDVGLLLSEPIETKVYEESVEDKMQKELLRQEEVNSFNMEKKDCLDVERMSSPETINQFSNTNQLDGQDFSHKSFSSNLSTLLSRLKINLVSAMKVLKQRNRRSRSPVKNRRKIYSRTGFFDKKNASININILRWLEEECADAEFTFYQSGIICKEEVYFHIDCGEIESKKVKEIVIPVLDADIGEDYDNEQDTSVLRKFMCFKRESRKGSPEDFQYKPQVDRRQDKHVQKSSLREKPTAEDELELPDLKPGINLPSDLRFYFEDLLERDEIKLDNLLDHTTDKAKEDNALCGKGECGNCNYSGGSSRLSTFQPKTEELDCLHVENVSSSLSQNTNTFSDTSIGGHTKIEERASSILDHEVTVQLNAFEEVSINVKWKRRPQKFKVDAELVPELLEKLQSSVEKTEYEVIIEQAEDEQSCGFVFVKSEVETVAFHLNNLENVSFEKSLSRNGGSIEPLLFQDIMKKKSNYENLDRSDEFVSVVINARSERDCASALLEEIAWGSVSFFTSYIGSEKEEEITECSSSQSVSKESSNVSLTTVCGGQNVFSDSFESLDVPTYILKEGSTATITCELNSLTNTEVVWYKGKKQIEFIPGKVDRVSHDLVEVLVISAISLEDSDIYNILVNGRLYPVACLIVELETVDKQFVNFLNPPQTLFVMEGQPAVLSCQLSEPVENLIWIKGGQAIHSNHRITVTSDKNGCYGIHINNTTIEDQGTYYAHIGKQVSTVTLIVEEPSQEKEVTVTASGTESDDDDYQEYVVPEGCTATIACELEDSDRVCELVWKRDGKTINYNDNTRIEHVINGLKHYLVIHNAHPSDSACYSVCFDTVEFKIAHVIVSNSTSTYAALPLKHISSSSLNKI